MRLAKANVDNMCTIMAGWCKTPLYKRKGDKKESFLNLEVYTLSTCVLFVLYTLQHESNTHTLSIPRKLCKSIYRY